MGHFVSSPRERGREIEKIVEEKKRKGLGRKRKTNESEKKKTEKTRNVSI